MNNALLSSSSLRVYSGGRFIHTYDGLDEFHRGEIRNIKVHCLMSQVRQVVLELATTDYRNARGLTMPFANFVRSVAIRPRKYAMYKYVDGALCISDRRQRLLLLPASHYDSDDMEHWFLQPAPISTPNS